MGLEEDGNLLIGVHGTYSIVEGIELSRVVGIVVDKDLFGGIDDIAKAPSDPLKAG